jgi:Uma2 family endonuclease
MTAIATTAAFPPAPAHMTREEFVRWSQRYEGPKCEWVEGRVVQQAVATKRHGRIVANVLRVLSARLDLDVWSIIAETMGVEPAGRLRLPDLVVERLDAPGSDLRAEEPVLLLEVLSPSSVATDFVDKRAEYLAFPSLVAYVIASQDEAVVWVWQRATTGEPFPVLPTEVRGRAAVLTLTGVAQTGVTQTGVTQAGRGIDLPLADVYARIPVP